MKNKTKIIGLAAAALVLVVAGVSVYVRQISVENLQGATIIPGVCGLNAGGTPGCASGAYYNLGAVTASDGSVTWNWKCLNTGVGASGGATCSAQRPKIDGACGTANGKTAISTVAAGTTCAKGAYVNIGLATDTDGVVTWNWKCLGQYGGVTPTCQVFKTGTTIDGSCGSAQSSISNDYIGAAPSASAGCSSGTMSGAQSVTSLGGNYTSWTWSCDGHGGSSITCSATGQGEMCNLLSDRAAFDAKMKENYAVDAADLENPETIELIKSAFSEYADSIEKAANSNTLTEALLNNAQELNSADLDSQIMLLAYMKTGLQDVQKYMLEDISLGDNTKTYIQEYITQRDAVGLEEAVKMLTEKLEQNSKTVEKYENIIFKENQNAESVMAEIVKINNEADKVIDAIDGGELSEGEEAAVTEETLLQEITEMSEDEKNLSDFVENLSVAAYIMMDVSLSNMEKSLQEKLDEAYDFYSADCTGRTEEFYNKAVEEALQDMAEQGITEDSDWKSKFLEAAQEMRNEVIELEK